MGKHAVRQATCHVEELHYGRGLCKRCYEKWYWHTSAHRRAYQKARNYYKNNPEKYAAYAAKRKAKWRAASAKLVKACPICGDIKRLVWDHNHASGAFRAYICSFCNSMLGYARDRADLLRRAAIYLEEHQ